MKKPIPPDAVLIPPEAERVYQGALFDFYQWQQELFDGSHQTFDMVRRPDIVATIGIVDGKIVTVVDDQPHRGVRVGLPGGRVTPEDASLVGAAQREMREETGYEFASWRLVEVVQLFVKVECFEYFYLATEPSAHHQPELDLGGEEIEIELCDYETAVQKIHASDKYSIDYQLLSAAGSLDGLLDLPEFSGKEVDIPVKE